VCVVWKCRPDVHCELGGRESVVLGMGWEAEGGVVGMWYATAEGPERRMGWVFRGRGERG